MKKLYYDSAYIRTFEVKSFPVRREKRGMRLFWTRRRFTRRAADSRMIRESSAGRM